MPKQPRRDIKAVDLPTLFRERMGMENRLEAFEQRLAALQATEKNKRTALYAAMREFGYKNADDERLQWQIAKTKAFVARWRQKQHECQARYRAKKRAEREAAKGSTSQES